MDKVKCFSFSIYDLRKIKEIVENYKKLAFLSEDYPQITETPFRVTLKANQMEPFANPDSLITCVSHRNNVYDFHYETSSSALLRMSYVIPPFDYSLRMVHRDDRRYEFVKKPNNASLQFLHMSNKFGVQNENVDMFLLACQCAQFTYAVCPCIYKISETDERINFTLLPDFEKIAKRYIAYQHEIYKHYNLTKGWDVVNLTVNQLDKVYKTCKQFDVCGIDTFPLQRFCLSVYDKQRDLTKWYFFEKNGSMLKCGAVDMHYNISWFDIGIEGREANDIFFADDSGGKKLMQFLHKNVVAEDNSEKKLMQFLHKNAEEHEMWCWYLSVFFMINAFMLNIGDVTMDVEVKHVSSHSVSDGRERHHHKNSVRLFKTYTLVRDWKTKARKKTEITCTAWGVRGHFRHYKNGKTVFIEPFVKGKERANYIGKEYALLPYKDA